jgi:hypothetical protein
VAIAPSGTAPDEYRDLRDLIPPDEPGQPALAPRVQGELLKLGIVSQATVGRHLPRAVLKGIFADAVSVNDPASY